jgi:hypothetical protein
VTPGQVYQIQAYLTPGLAKIAHTEYNAWCVLRTLHTFVGVSLDDPRNQRDWVLTPVWAYSMDAVAAGMIFKVLTSFYMWWGLREKRKLGLVALGLGTAVCWLFVFGLRWIYAAQAGRTGIIKTPCAASSPIVAPEARGEPSRWLPFAAFPPRQSAGVHAHPSGGLRLRQLAAVRWGTNCPASVLAAGSGTNQMVSRNVMIFESTPMLPAEKFYGLLWSRDRRG